MTIRPFDTREMLEMVDISKPPSNFFRSRYFGRNVFSRSRKIDFDEIEALRRVSPFVAPKVKGRVVNSRGRTLKTFEPAYVKDTRIINPEDTTVRPAGAPVGAAATPDAMLAFLTADGVADQQSMLQRRIELMCIEIVRTGAVSISGPDYPEVNVSFGRHVDLSSAMDTPFGDVADGDDPLREVKAKALIAKRLGHVYPRDLVFSQLGFDQFSLHPTVLAKLDKKGVEAGKLVTEVNGLVGAQFQGTYDGFAFWTFDDWYLDDNGVEQRMMPEDEVIGCTSVDGVVAFGAIQDFDAGVQALEFFAKSWIEKDPSGLTLLGQSAPLPVPRRINGSFRLTGTLSEESSS